MKCIVVLDVRSLLFAPHSGVGRFTQCLAEGLVEVAESGQQFHLILAGTREFAGKEKSFAQRIVLCRLFDSPLLAVSQLGFGSASSWWVRKPRFLWSTVLFLAFAWHMRRGCGAIKTLVWFAPDNIDRPLFGGFGLFLATKQIPQKILQIVHDLIPLRYPNRDNRFLRLQMRLLLGPLFRNGIRFAPISQRTERDLGDFVPRQFVTKNQITNRVGKQFALDLRAVNAFDTFQMEKAIQAEINGLWDVLETHCLLKSADGIGDLSCSRFSGRIRFLLGVGRDESYKSWPKVTEMMAEIAPVLNHNLWFVHVCTSASTSSFYGELERHQEQCVTSGVCVVYPRLRVVRILELNDLGLACLYRLADALIHLSQAEGYGLPLAEAYLAGLPLFAVKSNGFAEVLPHLQDQSAVHFFDGLPDYEVLREALQPEASLEHRMESRRQRSIGRLSDGSAHDLLLSNAAMGLLAVQVIHEVTAGIY